MILLFKMKIWKQETSTLYSEMGVGGVNLVSVTFFKFLNGLGQGMDFKSRNFKGKIVLLLHAKPHDVTCSAAALLYDTCPGFHTYSLRASVVEG